MTYEVTESKRADLRYYYGDFYSTYNLVGYPILNTKDIAWDVLGYFGQMGFVPEGEDSETYKVTVSLPFSICQHYASQVNGTRCVWVDHYLYRFDGWDKNYWKYLRDLVEKTIYVADRETLLDKPIVQDLMESGKATSMDFRGLQKLPLTGLPYSGYYDGSELTLYFFACDPHGIDPDPDLYATQFHAWKQKVQVKDDRIHWLVGDYYTHIAAFSLQIVVTYLVVNPPDAELTPEQKEALLDPTPLELASQDAIDGLNKYLRAENKESRIPLEDLVTDDDLRSIWGIVYSSFNATNNYVSTVDTCNLYGWATYPNAGKSILPDSSDPIFSFFDSVGEVIRTPSITVSDKDPGGWGDVPPSIPSFVYDSDYLSGIGSRDYRDFLLVDYGKGSVGMSVNTRTTISVDVEKREAVKYLKKEFGSVWILAADNDFNLTEIDRAFEEGVYPEPYLREDLIPSDGVLTPDLYTEIFWLTPRDDRVEDPPFLYVKRTEGLTDQAAYFFKRVFHVVNYTTENGIFLNPPKPSFDSIYWFQFGTIKDSTCLFYHNGSFDFSLNEWSKPVLPEALVLLGGGIIPNPGSDFESLQGVAYVPLDRRSGIYLYSPDTLASAIGIVGESGFLPLNPWAFPNGSIYESLTQELRMKNFASDAKNPYVLISREQVKALSLLICYPEDD